MTTAEALLYMAHDQQFPIGDNERRVPQYSPEWVAHVTGGGAVRNGNILVSEAPIH